MGCTSSAAADPKAAGIGPNATKEQMEEMCLIAARQLMHAASEHVLEVIVFAEGDSGLRIKSPGAEMQVMRNLSQQLRSAAVDMGASPNRGQLTQAMGKPLALLADNLDGSIAMLDKQFSDVAQHVLRRRKAEIHAVYTKIFQDLVVTGSALYHIRGKAPYGKEEYEKCPPHSITDRYHEASFQRLYDSISPVVKSEIEKSPVIKAWDKGNQAIKAADAALLQFLSDKKKETPEPRRKLDVPEYIVKEIINEIGVAMGKFEESVRQDAAGKSKEYARTFELCFSSKPITKADYSAFKEGQ